MANDSTSDETKDAPVIHQHDARTQRVVGDCANRDDSKSDCGEFHIVGIGASAGGLEALEQLFKSLSSDSGAAYVVVQHLSPDFKSHMVELLSRHTEMPIYRVENGVAVEPNAVYLIPPRKEMVISGGKLLLTEKSGEKSFSHPIDQFFRSLAADVGRYSIGVILSGTGSDGSRGIRDIHDAGGLVISQDETTAAFDGMPLNAQATGIVDLVIPPAGISEAIVRYVQDGLTPEAIGEQELIASSAKGVDRIFELLHGQHGLDFSHYKATTVGRRIQRRIDLLGLNSIDDYLAQLEATPEELNELYKDLLIGVTKFFRDPAAFDVIATNVLPVLVRRAAESNQTLRVWVCGCASGEEAYSLAILLDEERRRLGEQIDIKIFATDAHHVSLNTAARGVFSEEALEELSDERRRRYFDKKRDGYHVDRDLRRYIVFAPHNVISDAPFTQMDLVTCRNMLIYLQPTAQKKTLSLFHFALKANGTLFLGPSESPGELSDEFETVDKRWRVYTKRRDVRLPIDTRVPFVTGVDRMPRATLCRPQRDEHRIDTSLLSLYDKLLDRKMPPSILVSEDYLIRHVFGGAERFLRLRGGRPSTTLLDVIIDPLKPAITGAVQHAIRKQDLVRYTGIRLVEGGDQELLGITVEPIHNPADGEVSLLIEFEVIENEETVMPSQSDGTLVDMEELTHQRVAGLESELRYSQENLQATVEEMETSNEELQATNEELVASNEELQSTNEELHSVNEELYTVNAEHQRRVEELARANGDMDNLLATTRVGVIFLDGDLFIRRFTPEIGRLFHLMEQDVGRSIEGFAHHFARSTFLSDLRAVVSDEREAEFEITDRKGNLYLARLLPYRTSGDIDGVVLTLIDIKHLKETQIGLERFKFMAESAIDGISLVDAKGRLRYVNPSMCRTLGYEFDELTQMTVMDVNPDYSRERFQELFHRVADKEIKPFEAHWKTKSSEIIPIEISCSSVKIDDEQLTCGQIRNITERKAAEFQLRLQSMAVDAAVDGVIIADARQDDAPIVFANTGFLNLTGYSEEEVLGRNCRFLQGPRSSRKSIAQMKKAITNAEPCRTTILNYRKNGTTFWNDLQITPVFDDDGELLSFIGVQHDVSSRVESKQEIKRQTERLEAILDTAAEGIFGLDTDGRCTFCNRSALKMLGYETEVEVLDKPLLSVLQVARRDGTPQSEKETRIFKAIGERRTIHVEDEIFWRKDGTSFDAEYWSSPIIRGESLFGAVVTFQDISDRAKLRSELEVLGTLVDASSDAIITWNLDGGIISWNAGAERLYGYTAEEAVGRVTHELLKTTHDGGWNGVRKILVDDGEWSGELLHVAKGGSEVVVSTRHQLIYTAGENQRVLEINRDITNEKAVRTELENARILAQQASSAKSQFLANMSHELRTPMTAVLGYADLLQIENEDELVLDKVTTIKRNGEYLLSLLNDILDLSKVEAGKLDFDVESVDVVLLVNDVISLMNVRASQKGLRLTHIYETSIPTTIAADRIRLRQVLVNLLSNAIKFTESGETRLELSVDEKESPACLAFAVCDTGIGMSSEAMSELFKPFTQVGNATQRLGGTGLGLSISKRLAEQMGGVLTVSSEQGVGSCFTLKMPVTADELTSRHRPEISSTLQKSEKPDVTNKDELLDLNVLLADDHEEIRFIPEYFLNSRGANVTVAENGQEAIDHVSEAKNRGEAFDIILMDMQMPVLDGREAVKRLRDGGCETPIIALTAQAMAGDEEDILSIGCDAHVAKPFDGPRLLEIVAELLNSKS